MDTLERLERQATQMHKCLLAELKAAKAENRLARTSNAILRWYEFDDNANHHHLAQELCDYVADRMGLAIATEH